MNFKNKKILMTGTDGFLGYAIANKLKEFGATVYTYKEDLRNPVMLINDENMPMPRGYEYDYFFHFGDPSSMVQFQEKPRYAIETTIKAFLNVSTFCKENGIKMIWPSTGALSDGIKNSYAMCKKLCEEIQLAEGMDAVAIRLFAAYGPGEGKKRNYCSVPYLFARDMYRGVAPKIWGDGTQTRDFIFIEDAVMAILRIADESDQKVIDVGSGDPVSFNHIVNTLNEILNQTEIKPQYILDGAPKSYVQQTCADTKEMSKHFIPQVDLKEGLKKLIEEVENEESNSNDNN